MVIVTENDVHFIQTKEDVIELLPEEVRPYMNEVIDNIVEEEIENERSTCHYDCSYIEELDSEMESYKEELSIAAAYFYEDILPMLTDEQKESKEIQKMRNVLGGYY